MNINKNSLWYRLADLGAGHKEVSNKTCVFFWQAVLGLGVGLFILTVAVFLGSISGFFLLYPITQFLLGTDIILAGMSFFVWLMVAKTIKTLTVEEEIGPDWLRKEIKIGNGRVKVDKQPSIIVEFIKAKKSKFCPTLTFTD